MKLTRAKLQVIDFKDRRNVQQRQSYSGITAARQAMLDRNLQAEFERRVADNVCRRLAAKLAGVIPASARSVAPWL